jgi:hypothetical protein
MFGHQVKAQLFLQNSYRFTDESQKFMTLMALGTSISQQVSRKNLASKDLTYSKVELLHGLIHIRWATI